jgi:hypothetical protein
VTFFLGLRVSLKLQSKPPQDLGVSECRAWWSAYLDTRCWKVKDQHAERSDKDFPLHPRWCHITAPSRKEECYMLTGQKEWKRQKGKALSWGHPFPFMRQSFPNSIPSQQPHLKMLKFPCEFWRHQSIQTIKKALWGEGQCPPPMQSWLERDE